MPTRPTNMSLNKPFQIPKMLIALLHSLANWGHQMIFNEFLEDGQMVARRHSNEGEVIEQVDIILFLDICKSIFFSRHFRPITGTLLIITYVN